MHHHGQERPSCSARAIVALVGIVLAQHANPRSRCSEISFDVRVCMEKNAEDKMGPGLGELESSSAGTGIEAPGQQGLSNWEMERTTVDGCPLVDASSDLGEIIFPSKNSLLGRNTIIAKFQHRLPHQKPFGKREVAGAIPGSDKKIKNGKC